MWGLALGGGNRLVPQGEKAPFASKLKQKLPLWGFSQGCSLINAGGLEQFVAKRRSTLDTAAA